MILIREQIEKHKDFVYEIELHICDRSKEDVLWIDSITNRSKWVDGVSGWVINYTYVPRDPFTQKVQKDKLLTGIRIVDNYNSPTSYKVLCDMITVILRDIKLNSIGI